jgi:hypothetical protein
MKVFKATLPNHREFLASHEMTAETGPPSPAHLAYSIDRGPLAIKKPQRHTGSGCSNPS